jgi:hypothetical protein
MNTYLEVLQEKAKKIGANIEECAYDKDCIKNILALKVRNNLENENIEIIKEKAIAINATITKDQENKEALLDSIEQRVKEILEEENELFTSIELNQNFIPIDLG